MTCAAEDWAWFDRLSRWRLLLLGVLGFLVAVLVEQQALLTGLWHYKNEMPRVPFLGVAWIPVMQMILIPLGLAAASHFWGLRDSTRQGGPRV